MTINSPPEPIEALWVALNCAQQRAQTAIESALKNEGLPSLDKYDVLIELERAGEEGLRFNSLQKALLLPQYGTSRLVHRMEAEGLVRRQRCSEDGRGYIIKQTAKGKRLRQRMWPVYARAMEEAIGQHLSEKKVKAVTKALRKLGPLREDEG